MKMSQSRTMLDVYSYVKFEMNEIVINIYNS